MKTLDLNKKFFKDHLPEILTGMSVFGTVVSDALFVYAAKKEQVDHDKKHWSYCMYHCF